LYSIEIRIGSEDTEFNLQQFRKLLPLERLTAEFVWICGGEGSEGKVARVCEASNRGENPVKTGVESGSPCPRDSHEAEEDRDWETEIAGEETQGPRACRIPAHSFNSSSKVIRKRRMSEERQQSWRAWGFRLKR